MAMTTVNVYIWETQLKNCLKRGNSTISTKNDFQKRGQEEAKRLATKVFTHQRIPKRKQSPAWKESPPPRKILNVFDGGSKNPDSESESKKNGKHAFLGAIIGGFMTHMNASKGISKRKNSTNFGRQCGQPINQQFEKETKPCFTDDEKVNRMLNKIFPLIVGTSNHNLARCLIDEGSFVDIMYEDAFEKPGLRKEDLKSYDGT